MELIQTDCAINSGNSGGALFNMYGEVVGITNSKYSNNGTGEASIDNIAFAIPIDNIRSIVDSLITDAVSYGLPQGAAVGAVTEGAPAAEAGLRAGDIITAMNGEAIENSNDLIAKVKKCQAGDEIKLSVYRKGSELEVTVKVAEKKQETGQQTAVQQSEGQQNRRGQQRGYGYPDIGGMFGY